MNTPFFAQSSYVTNNIEPSLLAKMFPSLSFYPPLLWIVFKAGCRAKKQRYNGQDWINSSEETVHALEQVGCRLDVSGLEHFRSMEGPCVFIGNHMSTLETFVLPSMIQPWKDVTFVVKQSLVDYPVFGHVLRSRNPIVVGRTNPREDLVAVLEGGCERLAAGRSVIVFPQSTRNTVFDPAQFNSIGVKLAKRAGVPIVPIALKSDAWGNGTIIKDFGPVTPDKTIHFAFGEPLVVEGAGKAEHQYISDFIATHLDEWNRKEQR